MKHVRSQPRGSFTQFSLACMCDPDRIIQDHAGIVYCGECMVPLERVESRELPAREQEDILVKLKLQKKMASEDAEFAEYSVEDKDDND